MLLVEIEKEVPIHSTIYPICLPETPNIDKDHLNRESGNVVGFGQENDSSKTKTMRQLSQKIRSYNWCNIRYNASNAETDLISNRLLTELPQSFDDTLLCAMNRYENLNECIGSKVVALDAENQLLACLEHFSFLNRTRFYSSLQDI